MRIKKFDDSETYIWNITIEDEDGDKYTTSFSSEMLACDHHIKYVNKVADQKFEPFLDDDGNRFFADIEENEEYDECLEYCSKNHINIDINRSKILTKPKTGRWEI